MCVCVVEEPSPALWLWSSMLLLSRGDRSEPAVSRTRWMLAAWVKMCFCRLSLGDFRSALSRAHSPGQGAPLPLLPPRAGDSWQMYLDMIFGGAAETRLNSLLAAFLCWNLFVFLFFFKRTLKYQCFRSRRHTLFPRCGRCKAAF